MLRRLVGRTSAKLARLGRGLVPRRPPPMGRGGIGLAGETTGEAGEETGFTSLVMKAPDMPDGLEPDCVKAVTDLSVIDAAQWDACAGKDNPFLAHGFLMALEESGSVGPQTGWQPCHMVVEDARGQIIGAAPMYLKGHSYGEYVFDHAWAHAYDRAGGSYYPKLQIAVPFTPVTGPRLLIHPEADGERVAAILIGAIEEAGRKFEASSAHVTFPIDRDLDWLTGAGWLKRVGVQYHWNNNGYAGFDDFLAALSSRKRKAIRKERKAVAEAGVEILTLTGGDLEREHMDAFYRFYLDTSDRKWGWAYLTRDFFHRLRDRLADRVALVMVRAEGRWVAGALNLIGQNTLYGRNWGCVDDYKFLHFEACYYRAIDFAIENGLATVEAGAQGQHKIQRGYLPTETYSAHWFADPHFTWSIGRYLEREREHQALQIAALMEESPFRKGDD